MFIAPYEDVFLVGRPDVITFIGGNPILIFEFKFSKYSEDFLSYHSQARYYGLIMKEIGFDVKNLFYSIVIFKPEMREMKKLIKEIPYKIMKDFLSGNLANPDGNSKTYGEIKAYITKFNNEEAERNEINKCLSILQLECNILIYFMLKIFRS